MVLIAVYGSIYSIVLAFVFCSVLVVILSRDFRVVLSMLLTIAAILATLLALFKVFGWTLGVVEAVALSILVGNSLDYCIHLTEGFISMDSRHIAFVGKFLVCMCTYRFGSLYKLYCIWVGYLHSYHVVCGNLQLGSFCGQAKKKCKGRD